jgi:hypothetical protein
MKIRQRKELCNCDIFPYFKRLFLVFCPQRIFANVKLHVTPISAKRKSSAKQHEKFYRCELTQVKVFERISCRKRKT